MNIKIEAGRGDLIYALAFLSFYKDSKNEVIISPDNNKVGLAGTKHAGPPITDEDIESIRNFLIKQDYISDVKKSGYYDIDIDTMRKHMYMDSALGALAVVYQLPDQNWRVPKEGWIDPGKYRKKSSKTKILINKSLRYHGGKFNYHILEEFKDDCAFIGLESEYEVFVRNYFNLNYIKTNTVTDLARTIYSSKLLVCNQSFAYTLAEAAAHPRILENFDNFVLPYTNNGHINISRELIKELANV